MKKEENTKLLVTFIKSKNIDTFGFIKASRFHELKEFYNYRKDNNLFNPFEVKDIGKKINPFIYMEDAKTIISFAFPYLYKESTVKNKIYFSKYTRGEDYHRVVNKYLQEICVFIENLGYMAKPLVDSNALPERYIAAKAGVGFIGKNNMLITKKYGSYVFLSEIITDLEIDMENIDDYIPKDETYQGDFCYGCDICIKVCPGKALKNQSKDNDFNKCYSYLSQKKELNKEELESLKGRLFGCDSCQDCCPLNKDISFSNIDEFIPKDFMNTWEAQRILKITKKDFRETYMKSSCGWRGKNILQRNALAALKYEGNLNLIKEEDITSEQVKRYYNILEEKNSTKKN